MEWSVFRLFKMNKYRKLGEGIRKLLSVSITYITANDTINFAQRRQKWVNEDLYNLLIPAINFQIRLF